MLEKLTEAISKPAQSLDDEESALAELNGECRAAVNRMEAFKPGFKKLLKQAHAYAVFPSMGKAAAVIGGAFGKGEVFEQGKLVGYAAVVQLTLGIQIGGDTFIEVVVFENKETLDRFKRGLMSFAANASAALIKAAASAATDFDDGAAVYVHGEGGLMLEAAIGGQRFIYRPAFIGRTRLAPTALKKRKLPGRRSSRSAHKSRTGAKSSHKRSKPAQARSRKKSRAHGRAGVT